MEGVNIAAPSSASPVSETCARGSSSPQPGFVISATSIVRGCAAASTCWGDCCELGGLVGKVDTWGCDRDADGPRSKRRLRQVLDPEHVPGAQLAAQHRAIGL